MLLVDPWRTSISFEILEDYRGQKCDQEAYAISSITLLERPSSHDGRTPEPGYSGHSSHRDWLSARALLVVVGDIAATVLGHAFKQISLVWSR